MRLRTKYLKSCVVAVAVALFVAAGSMAAEWNVNGNGDWNVDGNWVNPGTFPNGTDAVADLTQLNLTASRTITVQAAITIGTLEIGDSVGTSRYDLQPGTGSLTFDVSSGSAKLEQASSTGANGIYAYLTLLDDLVVTNGSTSQNLLFYGQIDNGGNDIIFNGSGFTACWNTNAIISGAGAIIKNGSGYLRLSANPDPVHTFSGGLTINGGVVLMQNNHFGSGPLTINGGVLENYWSGTLTRTLGSAAGQVQVTGGTSGFSGSGSSGFTVRFNNNASYEVVWGSAYFAPDILVLQSPTANQNGDVTIQNKIDLNGADRTITCNRVHDDEGGYSRFTGVIRTSSGTAGIIKLGPGALRLEGANTYNGNTIVSAGTLQFSAASAIGGSGRSIIVSNGAVVATSYAVDNAFLNRLEENTNAFTVALNVNSANDLDFSSSTGANLVNASLGVKYNSTRTYSGTLTPNSDTYRLGGGPYGTLTVSSALTGSRSLVVSGNVTLSGSLSYDDDTTVNSGTLTVNSMNSQDDRSVITIAASGATLSLNYVDTNTVEQLFIGAAEQAVGVYGAGGTPLAQITGTGALNVTGPPPAGTVFMFQ